MNSNQDKRDKNEDILMKINDLINKSTYKETMSIAEAAAYTGIGTDTLRALVNKKDTDFPFFRIGKKVIIKRTLLDEWLDKVSIEHRNI